MACTFCQIVAGEVRGHVVLDEPDVVGFLDARPVFKGHTLLVTREHHVTLPELPGSLLTPLFTAAQRVAAVVPDAFDAQGTFVALNNVVSQSVAHIHVHVVPRTKGDGLRGFFWPRQKYEDEDDAAAHAQRLRDALGS